MIHGRKAGFQYASSDTDALFGNGEINTIVVATRHDTHAELVIEALKSGKHVFVEKPLAITHDQLFAVEKTYRDTLDSCQSLHLMIGFNRRFSPHIVKMKGLLESAIQPKSFIITVNSGSIPAEHWTQDPEIGGGRIIGEACHFVDLMRYLAGSSIDSVHAYGMGAMSGSQGADENAVIALTFADGSFGSINYLSNGARDFPKERIEVFVGGRVLQLDNFRRLRGFGWGDFKKLNLLKQDKGQQACAARFLRSLEVGSAAPIAAEEIFEVSRATIEAAHQLLNQC